MRSLNKKKELGRTFLMEKNILSAASLLNFKPFSNFILMTSIVISEILKHNDNKCILTKSKGIINSTSNDLKNTESTLILKYLFKNKLFSELPTVRMAYLVYS